MSLIKRLIKARLKANISYLLKTLHMSIDISIAIYDNL